MIHQYNKITASEQSGSYLASDVTLLLDIVDKDSVNNVPVDQKEALIQSGKQHYSDMLTLEQPPTPIHEAMYLDALQQGKSRTASDINNLSMTLLYLFKDHINGSDNDNSPLILVSLVRAGLPIGVLLQRALSDGWQASQQGATQKTASQSAESQSTDVSYGLASRHYGVSIIRDRGLDPVALHTILTAHPDSPIVFVDGWTGKGAIYGELQRSLARFNQPTHPHFDNIFHQGAGVIPLLTLADPAGVAWLSASCDDWLIPSGLLGSTVSGLISRTLYSEPSTDLSQGLHQSIIYKDMQMIDHSLEFIETIDMTRKQQLKQRQLTDSKSLNYLPTFHKPRYYAQAIIEMLAKRYQVSNLNRIKPTIAEATRAVMRRDPDKVLLAASDHADTQLLRHLCQQKGVSIDVVGKAILPYQAVTIIKKRDG